MYSVFKARPQLVHHIGLAESGTFPNRGTTHLEGPSLLEHQLIEDHIQGNCCAFLLAVIDILKGLLNVRHYIGTDDLGQHQLALVLYESRNHISNFTDRRSVLLIPIQHFESDGRQGVREVVKNGGVGFMRERLITQQHISRISFRGARAYDTVPSK